MKTIRNWGISMVFDRIGLVAGASNVCTEATARSAFLEHVESAYERGIAFAMEVGPWARIQLLGPRGKVMAEMIPLGSSRWPVTGPATDINIASL